MKKAILVSIVLCLVSITIIGVYKKYKEVAEEKGGERTIEEAEVINANSSMGMEYLEFAGLTEEEANRFGNDNPQMDITSDGYVNGYFFRVPEDSIDLRLTQIYITGGDYHIFGIRVGDTVEQAAETLIQRGYRKVKSLRYIVIDQKIETVFQKDFVVIILETEAESSTIKGISLLTDYH